MRIALFITPHGFGHAVRSLEIARELLARGAEVEIVSDLPDYLVRENAGRAAAFRRARLDVGMVQRDSVRFDLDATREAVSGLLSRRDGIVSEEAARLSGCDGLVCDIPYLPADAARRAGIPAVGVSNFTWDWIYEAYAGDDPRWRPLVSAVRECYGGLSLYLRLPMHGGVAPPCAAWRDIPLIARRAARGREEVRRLLGIPEGARAWLVSFTALDLGPEALARIGRIPGAVFLFRRPLALPVTNALSLDAAPVTYVEALAASDGVITKPGYGIVADCVANGVPVVYSDRGFFPEYPPLVRYLGEHLPAVHLPSADLYAGRWEEAMEALDGAPRPGRSPEPPNGASVAADAILSAIEGRLQPENRSPS
ncbi:MAG: hypothetical protein NWE95_09595 [Candidatus Bathyarchaeota archaeon]|nr:hypothetical protein [Candidatus Bathyarchaeota archaeon]